MKSEVIKQVASQAIEKARRVYLDGGTRESAKLVAAIEGIAENLDRDRSVIDQLNSALDTDSTVGGIAHQEHIVMNARAVEGAFQNPAMGEPAGLPYIGPSTRCLRTAARDWGRATPRNPKTRAIRKSGLRKVTDAGTRETRRWRNTSRARRAHNDDE